ncbi:MAG: lactate racemase domain-containing protein [Ruthenibacterium sp.]
MALETNATNNIVEKLASAVALPRMVKVRQLFDDSHLTPKEITALVQAEMSREVFAQRIRPGMTVAITCGSRGVANIAVIIKAMVDFVKRQGARPFVFPAMGSHGGATAEGQRAILTGYNVTEELIGCPIMASMETVLLGQTPEGMNVFADKYASKADAIILCGRIKAHTAFRGPHESGLMKMAVIGMGKQHGAEQVHQNGFSELGHLLPIIGKVVLERMPVIGGIGLVENAFDQTCMVRALTTEEIWTEEPKLLTYSKTRLGKLYFDDLDLLVVDRIGKDISGDGMDPNVTGRYAVPYLQGDNKVQHIAVLDLTEETHGNCNGIGLADVTTKRLVDKVDVDTTFPNVVTSTVLCTPRIPLFTHTDKSCIQIALRTCNNINRKQPRIMRIQDTMHLNEAYISEALLPQARQNPNIEILSQPDIWHFDAQGNLW